jgi:phage terminase large subunit
VSYAPRGVARTLFTRRDPEILLSGPAGTGKSRACLEKLHLVACKYAGMRGLLLRKTHASLTSSGLVTFKQKVLHPLDGVTFFGGSAQDPPEFRYPNGSVLLVGGLDRPTKTMSTEYDVIYIQEATEATEDDWESVTTRLRNGVMPYQQLLADCNPDAPTHWLTRRADRGAVLMLESRHEDNPTVTPDYLSKLDALTGVRYLRLRKGLWAAAEGIVYEGWDRARHLIDAFPIPADWPRYWAVDFGFTHAFVWQAWAEDPDGRLYRYRELYRTKRLVEDHAADIKRITQGEPRPRAIVCDHDAEDRATLERHLGMKTTAAYKMVSPGIQAVASRLKDAGDGKPRLFLLRDALAGRDPELTDAALPTCTEEEVEGYIWDTSAGRKKGEEPVKKNDHGCDLLRYMTAHLDLRKRAATAGPLNITSPSTWRY